MCIQFRVYPRDGSDFTRSLQRYRGESPGFSREGMSTRAKNHFHTGIKTGMVILSNINIHYNAYAGANPLQSNGCRFQNQIKRINSMGDMYFNYAVTKTIPEK